MCGTLRRRYRLSTTTVRPSPWRPAFLADLTDTLQLEALEFEPVDVLVCWGADPGPLVEQANRRGTTMSAWSMSENGIYPNHAR